jgi:CRISPR-associated protein Csc2
LEDTTIVNRLVMFKRKQASPERLKGRELLRYYGIISDEKGSRFCEYNGPKACGSCPDCILYGFAVGEDARTEKSKVYTDSGFSITRYEKSSKSFYFNALYEHGTMTQRGTVRTSFGEQVHILPHVFFPTVVTLRDPIYEGFLYILGNILRTSRYGANETRTGRMRNQLVAIVFTNGEIFSSLRYTQAIYDHLKENDKWSEPLVLRAVVEAAEAAYAMLIAKEPVAKLEELTGEKLVALLAEVIELYQSDSRTKALLEALDAKTREYAQNYG